MATIKARVEKLEMANQETVATGFAFIVLTAFGETRTPIGYRFGNKTFIRQSGESQEMFRARCSEDVNRSAYGITPIVAAVYEY